MKKTRFRLLSLLTAALMVVPTVPVYAANEQSESSAVLADVESNFEISIPKQLEMIVDSNWHGAASYQAYVHGDIEVGSSVYVVPQARFNMVNQDDDTAAEVLTSVTQDKVEWSWQDCAQEDPVLGNGDLNGDGFVPGHSEGIFYFNIEKDDSGKSADIPMAEVETVQLKEGQSEYVVKMDLPKDTTGKVSVMDVAGTSNVSKEMEWVSDNEKITVDNGVIDTTQAEPGDTATVTGTTDDVTVEVPVEVYDIVLDKYAVTAHAGDEVAITATVLPESYNGTVTWNVTPLNSKARAMMSSVPNTIEGNTITFRTDDIEGNFDVIATYRAAVKDADVDILAGTPPTLNGVVDGETYQQTVTFTVGPDDTVVLDGTPITMDPNKSHTVDQNTVGSGTHTVVVTGTDGSTITATFTVEHVHVYGDFTETKAATCTDKGVSTRTCSICGGTDTTETDALGHVWASTPVEKTMAYSQAKSDNCWYKGYIDEEDPTPKWCDRLNTGKMYLANKDALRNAVNKAFTSSAVYDIEVPSETTVTQALLGGKLTNKDYFYVLVDDQIVFTKKGTKSSAPFDVSAFNATFKIPAGKHTVTYRVVCGGSTTDTNIKYQPIGNITIQCNEESCSRCGISK